MYAFSAYFYPAVDIPIIAHRSCVTAVALCIAELPETNCPCSQLRLKRLGVHSTHLLAISMQEEFKNVSNCLY